MKEQKIAYTIGFIVASLLWLFLHPLRPKTDTQCQILLEQTAAERDSLAALIPRK